MRCGGDIDPDLAFLADTSKVVGNSVYEKIITDKNNTKTYAMFQEKRRFHSKSSETTF